MKEKSAQKSKNWKDWRDRDRGKNQENLMEQDRQIITTEGEENYRPKIQLKTPRFEVETTTNPVSGGIVPPNNHQQNLRVRRKSGLTVPPNQCLLGN